MKVRILGPFRLEDGGRQLTIGGARQRTVLATLLLHANDVVPSERLLVDLWGENSPQSAANALQAAISRLRRVLPPGRLITRAPGYALRIFPGELDVKQFEQLLTEGSDALAAGTAADAARTLDQALSLWQGPALADFRYESFAQAEIARLEQLHLTCRRSGSRRVWPSGRRRTHRRVAAARRRAPGARASSRSAHARPLPWRPETEALEVYRDFRSVLREELGLEPSPMLRQLEAAILRHDPVLIAASAVPEVSLARLPVTVLCAVLRVASGTGVALDPEMHEVVNERSVTGLTAVLERYGKAGDQRRRTAGRRLRCRLCARGRCPAGGAGESGSAKRARHRSGPAAAAA